MGLVQEPLLMKGPPVVLIVDAPLVMVPLLVNKPLESIASVNVPLPTVSVPLLTTVPLVIHPSFTRTVGLSPKGSVVPDAIVKVVGLLAPDLSMTTRWKLILGALAVALEAPSNVTVPELASQVGEPVWVKLPETYIVPLGAVNVPPEMA